MNQRLLIMEDTELGLAKRLTNWVLGQKTKSSLSGGEQTVLRRCHFEVMEPRRVLSADPVVVGVTYLEGDTGQDNTPDHFEVSFEGGSPTTQLSTFTINGDQDLSGTLTDGDMFFDYAAGLPGTGGYFPFQFDAATSNGLTASDIVSVVMGSNGLSLTVTVNNFTAGDKLGFTIDVDEVERSKVDKIASGVEFEGSHFTATFVDQHYTFTPLTVTENTLLENNVTQTQTSGTFYDHYDDLIAKGNQIGNGVLSIRSDNQGGQADRSAATVEAFNLVPKPVVVSGQVYEDLSLCNDSGPDKIGIANVKLTLQLLNVSTGKYETVAQTTTDTDGKYSFGSELGLMPGTYRIVETQPAGYLDVGATAGQVEGNPSGVVLNNANGKPNVIAAITIPLGGNTATNYDFAEVKPASISGKVWHDKNDNGVIDSGEEGIGNVLVKVTRLGPEVTGVNDPFANKPAIFVRTAADGSYSVEGLPPGIYEVVEVNNYPGQVNPLAGFIDGKDSIGNIGGINVGTTTNDRHSQITLCSGESARQYNFGELKPASISGHVSIATPDGLCVDANDPNYEGLAGVTVKLFDLQGNLVATTLTNAAGYYEFGGLRNGTYTVVEVQPNNYLDGMDDTGKVNGQFVGSNAVNDRLSGITLTSGQAGTNYDFCEHRPAQICGTVWHDVDNDGILEAGEQRIGGVLIELFDANGTKISETYTDAQGKYCFLNLYAGTYCVKETQPTSFVDGKESLGSVNGVAKGDIINDQFCNITVKGGEHGDNYDFGEIRLASLGGKVFGDAGTDCVFDPSQGDKPLANVTLILLNANGVEVARTKTDAAGNYLFTGLVPGTYTVRELQPNGYIDGEEMAGKVNGVTKGTVTNDKISGITLTSGSAGTNYDFCEHIPAQICGTVYHDRNNNGLQDSGEEAIANTKISLYDAAGNKISETLTDANGKYCFMNLIAGEYCVKETQPAGFNDGKDSVGTIGGLNVGEGKNDELCKITVRGGDKGIEYNFGELKLSSISGFVLSDKNGNCMLDANSGDKPIAGVTMELLGSNGAVIATTVTGANGYYSFDNLLPGTYSVRQVQPANYFNVDQTTGTLSNGQAGTGNDSGVNIITGITISSDQKLVQYNFCEDIPAEIHGRVWEDGPVFETKDGLLPANYRDLRDGVYQAGVDKAIAGVTMRLYFFNTDTSLTPRPVTLADVLPGHYNLGSNPNTPITAVTNANGEYHFTGLKAGNYIVLQEQPQGFHDANEIVGSTTGFSYNSPTSALTAPQSVISIFSQSQIMDSLINIGVNAGGISIQNNFTEVRVQKLPDAEPPGYFGPGDGFPGMSHPTPPGSPLAGYGGLAGAQGSIFTRMIGTSHGAAFQIAAEPGTPYTWHLSVINAGMPRATNEMESAQSKWLQAAFLNTSDWNRFDMDQANWSFISSDGSSINVPFEGIRFGTLDGIPISGDFDGDGIDEVAVYKDGYWMIDLDRNGKWDQNDLMAKLGTTEDSPVVGDWDGDGKDDIGIYGPIWERDPEAIAREPGLPNPDNRPNTRAKNVPPGEGDGASGARYMQLTSFGRQRADLIDHVFGIDETRLTPVTGDWNGNGIRCIGTFEGGSWRLDVNGDGEFDGNDVFTTFGQLGDTPVVGDFDGDGVEQIAVYRAGTWIIDSNNNHTMDEGDARIDHGRAGDVPVVGDWNGDGADDLGLYRTSANVSVFPQN